MILKEKLYCVSGFITLIGNLCSYHQSWPKMKKKKKKIFLGLGMKTVSFKEIVKFPRSLKTSGATVVVVVW